MKNLSDNVTIGRLLQEWCIPPRRVQTLTMLNRSGQFRDIGPKLPVKRLTAEQYREILDKKSCA